MHDIYMCYCPTMCHLDVISDYTAIWEVQETCESRRSETNRKY